MRGKLAVLAISLLAAAAFVAGQQQKELKRLDGSTTVRFS